jgi:hypothetical protein
MLTLDSLKPDKKLSVFLAIKFAEKALPIWEAQRPEDNRPRAAIEATQTWLNNPTAGAAGAVNAARAADTAYAAADTAYAADATAYAAYAAALAAAHAANAYAADSAVYAADRAAYALGKDKASFIHSVLMENADVILEHMVKEDA